MQTYFFLLNPSIWNASDSHLLQFVSAERQKKIKQYINSTDQRLSLYSALIVRMGLSKISEIPSNELVFDILPHGKPYCISLPEYDFSLSHTKNCILCCIAKGQRVGADVEKIITPPFEIMLRVFHPEEIQYVRSDNTSSKEQRFFKIWTQKEAYIKLIGQGFSYKTTAFNTLLPQNASSYYTWEYNNYMCSICMEFPTPFYITQLSHNNIFNFFTHI